MIRSVPGRRAALVAAPLLWIFCAAAAAQSSARPQLHVVENVRLLNQDDAPRVTLVLSGGRIEDVLEVGAETPPGARLIEGEGWLALPAFIDAFTYAGCEVPEASTDKDQPVSTRSDVRIDMRAANRKGVRAAFRAVDVFSVPEKDAEAIRAAGFGALLSAPRGNLLSGTSVVATTRDAAPRDTVMTASAFHHAAFRAEGRGYPGTLMGYMAQLRQFFLDADRHRVLRQRYAEGKSDPRPPFDAELEAVLPLLDGERRIVCHAESHRDIERWIKLADEFDYQIAISGGREAWRVADVLAERGVPVLLTLKWGDEVKDPDEKKKKKKKGKQDEEEDEAEEQDEAEEPPPADDDESEDDDEDEAEETDWEYLEPLAVRRERRRLWEENRDCALRLHEAGVRFAFGSAGDSSGDLLKRVRQVVEAGLPGDVALEALTTVAAEILQVEAHVGSLAPGKDATLGLWTGDPTTVEGKLAWLFVDGFAYEFELDDDDQGEPDEGVDASGTWTIEAEERGETRTSTAVLKMTPEGDVTGTLTRENPMEEGQLTAELSGHVSGTTLTLEGEYAFGEMEITFTLKGDLDGDIWKGDNMVKGPFGEISRSFEASRDPQGGAR